MKGSTLQAYHTPIKFSHHLSEAVEQPSRIGARLNLPLAGEEPPLQQVLCRQADKGWSMFDLQKIPATLGQRSHPRTRKVPVPP